jgi:DNA-binding NtrC family response regulator
MRTLIAGGEAEPRAVLAAMLSGEGYEPLVALEASFALDCAEREQVDLLLCGACVPPLDAPTFIDQYRQRGGRATVVVTGNPQSDAVLEALRHGAFDHIPLPFTADQVTVVVRRAVEWHRLRQEADRLREQVMLQRSSNGSHGSNGSAAPDPAEDLSVKRHTAALERMLIREALSRTGGNRTRAARLLDLSHRALLYKIREYGLR